MQVIPQRTPKRPFQKPTVTTQPPPSPRKSFSKSNSSSSTSPDKKNKIGNRKESVDTTDGSKPTKKNRDKKDKKRNSSAVSVELASPQTPTARSPIEGNSRFYTDTTTEVKKGDISTTDSKTERRKREIATQKHDIKNKMMTVG